MLLAALKAGSTGGRRLGTVEKTIKGYRGRMIEKLGARTVADLVRIAEKVGVGGKQP